MKFNMLGDANHAGPVRLSDVYSSAVGSAKDGVAASQRALYDAYNSLNSSIADISGKIWKVIKGTVAVSSNQAIIYFNTIPIDSGIVNISFRLGNYAGGGSALLNTGYFVTLISSTLHNEASSVTASGHAGDEYLTIKFSSSVSNGAILRYVITYCEKASIINHSW